MKELKMVADRRRAYNWIFSRIRRLWVKELKMVANGRCRTEDTRIAVYLKGGLLVFYKESLNKKLGEWEETKELGSIGNGELADDPSAINYILTRSRNLKFRYMSSRDSSLSIFSGFTDFRKAEEKDFPKEKQAKM